MSGIPPGRNWQAAVYSTPQAKAVLDDIARRRAAATAHYLDQRQAVPRAAASADPAAGPIVPRGALRAAQLASAAAEERKERAAAELERRSGDLEEKRRELADLVRDEEREISEALGVDVGAGPPPNGFDRAAAKMRLEVFLRVGEREHGLARVEHAEASRAAVRAAGVLLQAAWGVRRGELADRVAAFHGHLAGARADREALAAFGRLNFGFGWPGEFSAVLQTALPGDEEPQRVPPAELEAERRAATAREENYIRRLVGDAEAKFEAEEEPAAA